MVLEGTPWAHRQGLSLGVSLNVFLQGFLWGFVSVGFAKVCRVA